MGRRVFVFIFYFLSLTSPYSTPPYPHDSRVQPGWRTFAPEKNRRGKRHLFTQSVVPTPNNIIWEPVKNAESQCPTQTH